MVEDHRLKVNELVEVLGCQLNIYAMFYMHI